MGSGKKESAARSSLRPLAAANQGAKRRNSQWRCVQKFGNAAEFWLTCFEKLKNGVGDGASWPLP
jgi:hypothetical protein